jgi:putative oxidoreductase
MNRFFSSSPIWQQKGLAIIRIITGCFVIYHGSEAFNSGIINEYFQWDVFKTSPGHFLVYFGKITQLIAGILLVMGLLTRTALILLIGVFSFIAFYVGSGKIWYQDQHPFLFVLLALLFFFTGPGAWNLDDLFFKSKKK